MYCWVNALHWSVRPADREIRESQTIVFTTNEVNSHFVSILRHKCNRLSSYSRQTLKLAKCVQLCGDDYWRVLNH